jgi:hypothetical protein
MWPGSCGGELSIARRVAMALGILVLVFVLSIYLLRRASYSEKLVDE